MLDRAPILPVRLGFVAVGLGLLLTSGSVFSQNAARNDAFPLDIGNSWAYVGTVWWTTPNSRRILKEQVNWRIEVVDVIERRGVRAAILRGLPQDMVVMGRGRAPAEYLLVQIGEDKLFLLSGQRINEALRQLRNPRDPLLGLVQDSELVLDLPLFPGKTFCAASKPAPGRRPACWTVREQGPINLAAVRGLSGARQRERYTLDLQWEGDDIVWGFVPGVGLTSYAIGHYGAVSAVELDLVEANVAGKPGVPFLKTLDLTEGESATRPTASPGRSGSSPIKGERVEPASAAMVGSVKAPASGGVPTTVGSQPIRTEPREPEPPRDTDGDGVVDPRDACADTPAGASVNSSG
ncbi:MAG TPA: hypothetical protein VE078_09840, partial [Thermoanaerobaculia bacterium]|nr:hypothetical protein [Thermoanaerobaculia bacterium]